MVTKAVAHPRHCCLSRARSCHRSSHPVSLTGFCNGASHRRFPPYLWLPHASTVWHTEAAWALLRGSTDYNVRVTHRDTTSSPNLMAYYFGSSTLYNRPEGLRRIGPSLQCQSPPPDYPLRIRGAVPRLGNQPPPTPPTPVPTYPLMPKAPLDEQLHNQPRVALPNGAHQRLNRAHQWLASAFGSRSHLNGCPETSC